MSSDEGKLLIGGLSFDTNKECLRSAFCSCGGVKNSVVVKDREMGCSRGFGFITFKNPDDASEAMRIMNGESLDGCQIRVDLAGKSSVGHRGGGSGYRGGSGSGRGYSRGGRDDYRGGTRGGYGGGWDYYGGGGRGGRSSVYDHSGGSYYDN